MPEFYEPGKSGYPLQGTDLPNPLEYSLVALFDPTPSRSLVASNLASAGWAVLAINSSNTIIAIDYTSHARIEP